MRKFLLIFYCFLMLYCSSLPRKIQPPSFANANLKMKYAREAQEKQHFSRALRLYQEAYDMFTRGDHLEGKINASLSIARQYFYLGKPDESNEWLGRAVNLIENNLPQMEGAKAILLIEMAFEKNDYKRVIEISAATDTVNLEWQTEILCYTMVSKAQLTMDYQPEFQRIQSNLIKLQKKFDKRKLDDPGILSLAYYYSGYIFCNEKNWESARAHFEKARIIDCLIDNTYGMARDLYSLGQCYEKLGLFKPSISSFERSAEIFILLGNTTAAEKAKKRAESIKNK